MEELEKVYNLAKTQRNGDLDGLEIWMHKDLHGQLNIKEYKGLKIYSNELMPKEQIIIGKL